MSLQNAPRNAAGNASNAPSRSGLKRSAERHALIMTEVARTGYASMEALAMLCGTSTQTVRRDLTVLARTGRVERYHGGASLSAAPISNFEKRSGTHVAQKLSAVAPLPDIVPDGASLFLAGGSTLTLAAATLVTRRKLVIVTNNLHAAIKLYDHESFEVMVVGGWIRTASGSLTGEGTALAIDGFSPDFCVVSTSGIAADGTLLEMDPAVVEPVIRMLRRARKRILIADTSKFQGRGVVRTGHLSEIDYLLTDGPAPPAIAELLARHGVEHRIGPKPT